MPAGSITVPVMAPESFNRVAAREVEGPDRQAIPNTNVATVLCVFVLNIDALYRLRGIPPYTL